MNSPLRCKNTVAAFSKRTFDKALRVARPVAGLLAAAALCASLTGCSMSPIALSGPDTSAVKVSVHINGTVRGGQNPVSGAAVQLWAVGNSGYGSNATNLIGLLSGGGYCSVVPDTITSFVITAGTTSNTVTFTGNNLLVVGQTFSVSGLTSPKGLLLDGGTYTVSAATSTTFTANTSVAATASTTDSGTATPQCGGNEVAATGSGNEVLSGAAGSFSITGDYTCPTSSSQVYLTASGGNPGLAAGTNNSAIYLITPLGTCGSLSGSTSVVLSEVTTAATAFALGQYFTTTFGSSSTDSFGAPNTTQAQLGLNNAFATVSSLVNLASGNAITSTNLTGAGYTLTAVPDSAKLNTIADILAACVNSLGTADLNGNCTTLFTDVTPTGGTKPTDVLQAAVDMSLNAISNNAAGSAANITALYNLSVGTGSPFPGLSAAPSDWTLGIQYQDNAGTFFVKPQNIAVDSVGNVWVLSNNSGIGNLVELNPTGTPLSDIASLSEYGPFVSPIANPPVLSSPKTTTTTIATQNTVFTTTFGQVTNNPSMNPRNLAIDPSNNVWFTQTSGTSSSTGGSAGTSTIPASGNVFEVITSATGIPTGATYGFATGKSAYGLAIDSSGNVFVGQGTTSAYFGLYEFPYNSTPGNSLLTPVGFPPPSTTANFAEYISIDKAGNKIFTNGSATATSAFEITGATASSCALTANTLCQPSGSAYVTVGSGTGAYGLAEGTTGTWIANSGTSANSLSLVAFGGTTATTYGDANHLLLPKFPAVDGLGNVWVGNAVGPSNLTAQTGGSVSALTAAGAYLSPSNGGSSTVAPGFTHLGLNFPAGTAIDPSGNVWLANNAAWTAACTNPLITPSSSSTSGGNTCSSVFELVGAAAPVVTPIAAQTANGPTRP